MPQRDVIEETRDGAQRTALLRCGVASRDAAISPSKANENIGQVCDAKPRSESSKPHIVVFGMPHFARWVVPAQRLEERGPSAHDSWVRYAAPE